MAIQKYLIINIQLKEVIYSQTHLKSSLNTLYKLTYCNKFASTIIIKFILLLYLYEVKTSKNRFYYLNSHKKRLIMQAIRIKLSLLHYKRLIYYDE